MTVVETEYDQAVNAVEQEASQLAIPDTKITDAEFIYRATLMNSKLLHHIFRPRIGYTLLSKKDNVILSEQETAQCLIDLTFYATGLATFLAQYTVDVTGYTHPSNHVNVVTANTYLDAALRHLASVASPEVVAQYKEDTGSAI